MIREVLIFVTCLALCSSAPPPQSAPFVHPRGVGNVITACNDVVRSIIDYGAITGKNGSPLKNQQAINAAFEALQPCDTLLIPEGTYRLTGGLYGSNLRNNTIIIDGTMNFEFDSYKDWPLSPVEPDKKFADCLRFQSPIDLVVTGKGTLNGGGKPWWDRMILGTLPGPGSDSRPKLIVIDDSGDVLFDGLTLVNSPAWNLVMHGTNVEVRNFQIITDREYQRALKSRSVRGDVIKNEMLVWLLDKAVDLLPAWLLQPEDLNTDGLDASGLNFWVHDVKISNDDDSIAVKPSGTGEVDIFGEQFDCTSNMLFENMELIGFGASIGSVGPRSNRPCVDGITMRNVSMPGTGKGIYIKSNGDDCLDEKSSQLSNLLFEDFNIVEPWWYAIWIGPQQQHEPNTDLGLDCALIYPIHDTQCPTQGCSDFFNITLRNVLIIDPKLSPGVLLGNSTNPMQNIVFDNVKVKQSNPVLGKWPWHEEKFPFKGTYKSNFVQGTCVNGCDPLPDGFVNE